MQQNRAAPGSIGKRETIFVGAAALCLFLVFGARYWLASMGKPIWGDESVGLIFGRIHGYFQLLMHGSGEASPSPLFYMLDKFIYSFYGGEPQYWWDLRLFNRILPATYWALAGACVFAWSARRSREILGVPAWQSLCLGAGVAFFLHSCSFMNIYAIEDRGYSLWVSLSTLQLLAWLDILWDPRRRWAWARYAVLSVLMVFATFSALGQIGLSAAILVILRWSGEPRMLSMGMKPICLRAGSILLLSALVAFFYFRNSPAMGFSSGWFTYSRYFESIFEVIAKAFHHHSVIALAFTMPLLFLVLPLLQRREHKALALVAYNAGLVLVTFIYFRGSEARGGLWAPRYVIFLIPSMVAVYVLGLGLGLRWAANALKARTGWRLLSPWILLVVWAMSEAGGSGKKYVSSIIKDWPRLQERRAYAYNPSGKCRNLEGPDFAAEAFEALNDQCRGIAKAP